MHSGMLYTSGKRAHYLTPQIWILTHIHVSIHADGEAKSGSTTIGSTPPTKWAVPWVHCCNPQLGSECELYVHVHTVTVKPAESLSCKSPLACPAHSPLPYKRTLQETRRSITPLTHTNQQWTRSTNHDKQCEMGRSISHGGRLAPR